MLKIWSDNCFSTEEGSKVVTDGHSISRKGWEEEYVVWKWRLVLCLQSRIVKSQMFARVQFSILLRNPSRSGHYLGITSNSKFASLFCWLSDTFSEGVRCGFPPWDASLLILSKKSRKTTLYLFPFPKLTKIWFVGNQLTFLYILISHPLISHICWFGFSPKKKRDDWLIFTLNIL